MRQSVDFQVPPQKDNNYSMPSHQNSVMTDIQLPAGRQEGLREKLARFQKEREASKMNIAKVKETISSANNST